MCLTFQPQKEKEIRWRTSVTGWSAGNQSIEQSCALPYSWLNRTGLVSIHSPDVGYQNFYICREYQFTGYNVGFYCAIFQAKEITDSKKEIFEYRNGLDSGKCMLLPATTTGKSKTWLLGNTIEKINKKCVYHQIDANLVVILIRCEAWNRLSNNV